MKNLAHLALALALSACTTPSCRNATLPGAEEPKAGSPEPRPPARPVRLQPMFAGDGNCIVPDLVANSEIMHDELKRECANYCKHMRGDTSPVPRYEGEGKELRAGRIHFYTKAMERMYGPKVEGRVSSCNYSIDEFSHDSGSATVHFRIEVEKGSGRAAYSIGRTVSFRFTYILDANQYDEETGTLPAQPAWGPSREFPFGIVPKGKKKGAAGGPKPGGKKEGSAGSPNPWQKKEGAPAPNPDKTPGAAGKRGGVQPTSGLQKPPRKFLRRGNPRPPHTLQRMRIPRRA
ncbi:hypothetical protein JW721_05610 [Candidatus Micrarchaeota archaeon]|nr:hypothetical protein [Candidatus Micrarchaeota archaeon]